MEIYGKNIKLRAMEPDDMEMLRELINDPEIEKMIGGWSFPVSKSAQAKWYENAVFDKNNLRLVIESLETGEALGMVNLVDIDWKNRSAFHGIRLGNNAPRRKGIGTDAVMALMNYAFDEMQLVRVDTSWVEYNEPSLKLYKKCGWSIEGKKEMAKFVNGKYYAVYFGGILKSDFEEAKKELGWVPYDKRNR